MATNEIPGHHRNYTLSRHRRAAVWLVAIAAVSAFVFQLIYHAARSSVTIDEPEHTLAGYRYWECGDYGINPEHPPLAKLVASAPLWFRGGLEEPEWDCGSRHTAKGDAARAGRRFLIFNGLDHVLFPARIAASLFSLLLAAIVFAAVSEMFGRAAALTALAILAFEPTLIAHGSLVTTDMALTATAFAAVYSLYRYSNERSWTRLAVAGIACGSMLAAKHSAIVFVPVLIILIAADKILIGERTGSVSRQLSKAAGSIAAIFLIALVVLWAFYGFRYASIPNASASELTIPQYVRENGHPEMVDSAQIRILDMASRARVLPQSYLIGLADIAATESRNAFIFNTNYSSGRWFYFPLAFLVKSSIALLLLLPLGLLRPVLDPLRRRQILFILAPPLWFFAVSLTSKMNIGVRHILPVYPFFIVAAAVAAVFIVRRREGLKFVLAALLALHAETTLLRVAPNYIAFANDLWGGVDGTHNVFPGDSNTEWGQNNILAAEYLARENIQDCWYAPYSRPETMPRDLNCRFMPGTFDATESVPAVVPPVIEGTVLLSTTVLPPRGDETYVPIVRSSSPIAQIGGSIFVYRGRFEVPLASAFSYAARAEFLIRSKQFAEAVEEARQAVEMAPDHPRGHLSLGLALSEAGQKDEARRELTTAIELMRSNAALYGNAETRARRELEKLGQN